MTTEKIKQVLDTFTDEYEVISMHVSEVGDGTMTVSFDLVATGDENISPQNFGGEEPQMMTQYKEGSVY